MTKWPIYISPFYICFSLGLGLLNSSTVRDRLYFTSTKCEFKSCLYQIEYILLYNSINDTILTPVACFLSQAIEWQLVSV